MKFLNLLLTESLIPKPKAFAYIREVVSSVDFCIENLKMYFRNYILSISENELNEIISKMSFREKLNNIETISKAIAENADKMDSQLLDRCILILQMLVGSLTAITKTIAISLPKFLIK